MTIDDYLSQHIDAEPEHLQRLYRHTQTYNLYPRMCSGHLQGRILSMLSSIIAPKRILEVGAFTGYSALCLAEGLAGGGQLHTIEIDDEMEEALEETFARDPRIHLHIGDAQKVIPRLECQSWDLAFIDGNKRQYKEYYELILPRMNKGGVILADNTLWGMKVTALAGDPDHVDAIEIPEKTDSQTRAIMEFNDMVAQDPRVSKVLLPLRDGLTVIKVL